MFTVKKKDKHRDRGVAVGFNGGLIACVVGAVSGYFAEKKRIRTAARKKRERKVRRVRMAVKAARTAAYFVPMVVALAKAVGFIAERRQKKQEEPEESENVDIEIVQAEPVSSEEEVYERVNSENPET